MNKTSLLRLLCQGHLMVQCILFIGCGHDADRDKMCKAAFCPQGVCPQSPEEAAGHCSLSDEDTGYSLDVCGKITLVQCDPALEAKVYYFSGEQLVGGDIWFDDGTVCGWGSRLECP